MSNRCEDKQATRRECFEDLNVWTVPPRYLGSVGWVAVGSSALIGLGLVGIILARGETFGQRCVAAGHVPGSAAMDACIAVLRGARIERLQAGASAPGSGHVSTTDRGAPQ